MYEQTRANVYYQQWLLNRDQQLLAKRAGGLQGQEDWAIQYFLILLLVTLEDFDLSYFLIIVLLLLKIPQADKSLKAT